VKRSTSLQEALTLARKKEQWRQARLRKKPYKGPRWRVRWTILMPMIKGKRKQAKVMRTVTFRIEDYVRAGEFADKKIMKYGLHRVALDKIDPAGVPYLPERELGWPQRTRGRVVEARPRIVLAASIQEEDFGSYANLC
jgi:hypothetical protein